MEGSAKDIPYVQVRLGGRAEWLAIEPTLTAAGLVELFASAGILTLELSGAKGFYLVFLCFAFDSIWTAVVRAFFVGC